MKKTLTVNLNNIVFHIDDDAFDMLQTYLHDVADHFQSEDEKKEIMADIEARIAELFTEKLQKTKNVVNLIDVQEIIEIMGKPSEYGDEDDEPKAPNSEKKAQKSRRYYRDPENAVLGGVAGGLSAYFNIDVTIIRIALVLLVFVGVGFIIPIYIVVWLVAPEAITASQRLEMQGEDVTVESIKTEMNNAKSYVESEKFKQNVTKVGVKFSNVLLNFFKIIFGFVGAILGVIGVVLIGALILVLLFLIFEPSVINGFAPDVISNWSVVTPEKMVLFIISLILVIGCPIFILVYWAIRIISGRRESNHTASWVVLVLWLAGLFMFYSVGASTFSKIRGANGGPFTMNWSHSDNNGSEIDEERTCEPFHAVDVSGAVELVLSQDSVQKVTVSAQEDYLPKVITRVENGVLRIYTESVFTNQKVKVTISADSINSIVAKGACEVSSDSELKSAGLKLDFMGASKADLDLKIAGTVDVELMGATHVNLSGTANLIKSNGTGACQLDAEDLLTKIADVKVMGASHAKVYATEKLAANATGASGIDCSGSPKNVNKFTHIGSEIHVE